MDGAQNPLPWFHVQALQTKPISSHTTSNSVSPFPMNTPKSDADSEIAGSKFQGYNSAFNPFAEKGNPGYSASSTGQFGSDGFGEGETPKGYGYNGSSTGQFGSDGFGEVE